MCHNESMEETKARKNLLLIAWLIFIAEFLGIIGYYWLFDGYSGEASLTISRYVGLNPVTSIVFCICNLAIIVLMAYHLMTRSKAQGFIWRFLTYCFIAAFMAVSICPHTPDGGTSSDIHQFFAGIMFVIMALTSLLNIFSSSAKNKARLIYAVTFTIYALFFIVCDLFKVQWFMNGIFWYETAYLFGYFSLLMLS